MKFYLWSINSIVFEYGGICVAVAESLEEAQRIAKENLETTYSDAIKDIDDDPEIFDLPCAYSFGE